MGYDYKETDEEKMKRGLEKLKKKVKYFVWRWFVELNKQTDELNHYKENNEIISLKLNGLFDKGIINKRVSLYK